MSPKARLVSISCALALVTTGAAQAADPQIKLFYKPAVRFESSVQAHKAQQHAQALGAKGKRLAEKATKLAKEPSYALAGGVSQSTLDAIAACESGGNPAAVDSSGTYYGLYQFDMGTWASVGGSGSPAAASPEEQSYRASLLYARAGSSPWPVCGV
ncbi:MAG: resuscitation-promoting factor RpfB [Solirubrobacterales bacterium]|nr:resuscitation-promoting factor RpfB [Solirubrobacterales bacterium]